MVLLLFPMHFQDLAAILSALAAFDPSPLAMDQLWVAEMLVMVQVRTVLMFYKVLATAPQLTPCRVSL